MPAARDRRVKQADRNERAADHDRGLNEVRPDDGFDAAERGVNGRQNDNGNRRREVNPQSLSLVWSSAADHFVGQSEGDGCGIQPCARREQPGNHENRGSGVLRRNAESRGQIFIDRVNFVIVVRFDENVADQNSRQNRAESELDVSIITQRKTFAGCSEKRARACLGRDNGSEHRPPGNSAAAESEIGKIFLLATHVKANGDDDDEIKNENSRIDREPSVHVDLR